jgi:hypothetical protein
MSSSSRRRSMKRRGAVVIGIGWTTLAFVACGGRSDLSPPGIFSGAAGSSGLGGVSGVGASGGIGGSIGRGGSSGRGGSLGSFGASGGGFGGVDGFGGSSGFGGVSGSAAIGGVAGSAVGGVAGSSFGSGGIGECTPPPVVECQWCNCKACPALWVRCRQDRGCSELTNCMDSYGCQLDSCYVLGVCREEIERWGGQDSPSALMAVNLDQCARNQGCYCASAAGGASGFGGSAGFGGTTGFGGSAGTGCDLGDPCGSCLCNGCSPYFQACSVNGPCANLASCALRTGCVRFGNCTTVCARELADAPPSSVALAETFLSCAVSSECPCNFGTGGVGGFGGVAGTGGQTCDSCLWTNCEIVADCMNTPSCVPGFECAATRCYTATRGWDPSCVARCFPNDPLLAREMFGGLQCATTTCRPWCGTPIGP